MKLHGYFRSSASYRVRIALNMKGLTPEHLPHHLRKGEQCAPAYLAINPQGLVTGAGIAALATIPGTPPSDVDLIAPLGTIDAGEACIRVSGNVNLAALQVVNAANIQVQGTSTGVPTVQGPPVAALTAASNTAAASQQAAAPPPKGNDQPSIIIVEVMGYGGGSGDQTQPEESPGQKRQRRDKQTYNENSAFQVIGLGDAAGSSGR